MACVITACAFAFNWGDNPFFLSIWTGLNLPPLRALIILFSMIDHRSRQIRLPLFTTATFFSRSSLFFWPVNFYYLFFKKNHGKSFKSVKVVSLHMWHVMTLVDEKFAWMCKQRQNVKKLNSKIVINILSPFFDEFVRFSICCVIFIKIKVF